MMYRNYLTAILCVLILAGCVATHRYELSKDDKGHLVRLDTRTGEVMMIEDGQLIPVQGETTPEFKPTPETTHVTLPNDGKTWPPLTTYWDNGKLHYDIQLYPLSKRLKLLYDGYYNNSSFSMTVNDEAGKQVAWTTVPAGRLKHTINKMRNMEKVSAEGVILMTRQEYDSLADWQLQWNP